LLIEGACSRMNNNGEINSKIYTLSVPPSAADPYLHPNRHYRIIRKFQSGCNACHTLNSLGEVDFYLLLPLEEDYEVFPEKEEVFGLKLSRDNKLLIEIYYDDELYGTFAFDRHNQLDSYSLRFLVTQKKVNIYFICLLDEYFVCYGFKSINLPSVLTYDLARHLKGQEPLLLPHFSQDWYSDHFFNQEMLLRKAWGYYLDFTAMTSRMGSQDEAEEIVSLHILNAMARLQKSRRKKIREDQLIVWVGRRISLDRFDKPKEYYSVYLSGLYLTGLKKQDLAAGIFEESFKELPEYWGAEWVSPLAEEAIPLVTLSENKIFRLDLSQRFYFLSQRLFSELYQSGPEYQSNYAKLLLMQNEKTNGKLYNLWLRRWERGYDNNEQMSAAEIEKLIARGQEQDLTRIFMLLASVPEREIDDLIVKICEKYQKKAEPYLLAGLQVSVSAMQEAALLGLGILESEQAIPVLLKLIRQGSDSLAIWDTLLMLGDSAVQALAELIKDPVPKVRMQALKTLKLIGSPAALELIRTAGKEKRNESE